MQKTNNPATTKVRSSGRQPEQVRRITIDRNANRQAEGSCLIKFGHTTVLCSATVDDKLPRWLKGSGKGWITGEYAMLPRATNSRTMREAVIGRQSGRSQEIQRLIGRSLRAAVDLKALTDYHIIVDCDVLQADGSTRTAAITGAWVALHDALLWMQTNGMIKVANVLKRQIAAVSCGIDNEQAIIDLDYKEDSNINVDANFILSDNDEIVEVQMTAEDKPFTWDQLQAMTDMARTGIKHLIELQKLAIK